MAKDSVSLLDHLGWERAHVIGHSMGKFFSDKCLFLQRVLFSSFLVLIVVAFGFFFDKKKEQ